MSSLHQFHGMGRVYIGSGSITVATLAAAAEADYTISDANALVGDVIIVSGANALMETGVGILGAWVSANGTIKIRIGNFNDSAALNGGANTMYYAIVRAS